MTVIAAGPARPFWGSAESCAVAALPRADPLASFIQHFVGFIRVDVYSASSFYSCFQYLTVMSEIAMNVILQSFGTHILFSFGHIARSRITGSYVSLRFASVT